MNIELLSSRFKVKYIEESQIDEVYELCKGNPIYYKYCPPYITVQGIKKDMIALPNGKTLEDKYYIGFYDNNKLVAIMDLISKYPDEETAFIGFFMMSQERQGKGEGTNIITEVCGYLKEIGFLKVKLGYVKGNSQSETFWRKNHFLKTGIERQEEGYVVVQMEKKL